MNAALKATIVAIPKRTIRAVGGSVAVGATAIVLLLVGLLKPSLGIVVAYASVPLAIAVAVWILVAVARLRVVGILPNNVRDDDVIPMGLQPWIRCWLLVRMGLLGSGFLLVVIGAAVAIAKRDLLSLVIEAFVYLAIARLLLDAVFGTTFNAGVISSRR